MTTNISSLPHAFTANPDAVEDPTGLHPTVPPAYVAEVEIAHLLSQAQKCGETVTQNKRNARVCNRIGMAFLAAGALHALAELGGIGPGLPLVTFAVYGLGLMGALVGVKACETAAKRAGNNQQTIEDTLLPSARLTLWTILKKQGTTNVKGL